MSFINEVLLDALYNMTPAHPYYVPAKNQLFKIKITTNKNPAHIMRVPLQEEYVKFRVLQELKKQHPEIKIKHLFIELRTETINNVPYVYFVITAYGYVDPAQLLYIALIILGILGAVTMISWYIAQIEYYIAYKESVEHGQPPPKPPGGLPNGDGGLPNIMGIIEGIIPLIVLYLLVKVIK